MDNKIIVFLDSVNRTIVATFESETEKTLTISRPAILNVAPTQDKKLSVQLYPLMFREFLADRDSYPKWTYSKTAIAQSDIEALEGNLVAQYVEMFKSTKPVPAPTIKLFDAEES